MLIITKVVFLIVAHGEVVLIQLCD